tara:strand:- start:299 stop:454 length:156 start_codon:yes stop_codon:yes gene_type:complete
LIIISISRIYLPDGINIKKDIFFYIFKDKIKIFFEREREREIDRDSLNFNL